MPAYPARDGPGGGPAKLSVVLAHTHTVHAQHNPAEGPQSWCVRLYGFFVFILPYVFRLHGFFVLSKLNTQAIIHVCQQGACVQRQGDWWAAEGPRCCDVTGCGERGYCRTERAISPDSSVTVTRLTNKNNHKHFRN